MKIHSSLFLMALATGCATRTPAPEIYRFQCQEVSVRVRYGSPDHAELVLEDTTYRLRRTVSASGARYESGTAFFWDRGEQALIRIGDRDFGTCLKAQSGGLE